MPRGNYDRTKMKGKRGRRPVPVIFDEDVKVGKATHHVKITVDPRNFALELSGGAGTTYSGDIQGLMRQVGNRLGKEALHNLQLTQFATAGDDIINACKDIGSALDDKMGEIIAEQERDIAPKD